jgi:hypothetical protein
MKFQKITHGFVIQTFEDGKCPDYTYQPFNMVQPRTED